MKLNIIVIGNGMYVCGRGTDGYGTIFPALSEWKRAGNDPGEIIVCGTNPRNSEQLTSKANELSKINGIELPFTAYPQQGSPDPAVYKQHIHNIPKPACAVIVVPDHLHAEITKDCMEAGLDCLVVKPLAPTLAEAAMLLDVQHRTQTYGAVEFHKRWDRANLMFKDTFQSGSLGEPLYCLVEYSQRKSIPTEIFTAWVDKTNIFQYLGVHYVDILYFVTLATPKRVLATGQKNWLINKGIDTFDAVQCIIEWVTDSGISFTQTLLTNWIDPENTTAMSDQKIKLIGTKGRYESDQKERGIRIVTDDQTLQQPNPDFCSPYISEGGREKQWKGYGIESICTFLSDVIQIRRGRKTREALEMCRPTFKQSLVSTAVVEAANRSLEAGGAWITIPELGKNKEVNV